MSNAVVPDPARAQRLSQEVNRRLGASLSYVLDTVGQAIGVDPLAAEEWLKHLAETQRSFPLVHASYHAIVADVQSGDFTAAGAEAARLLRYNLDAPAGLSILNLDDLGSEAITLCARFTDIEEENRLDLVPASDGDVTRFRGYYDEARELMERNHPALLQEFEALVGTLILVGQAGSHQFTLGAVSCFETWGALFLNPGLQADSLDLVATIAHECTHLQLFAMALDEPLVLNPREERHYSPLRQAPRSMDGIFHATIVSARMAYALRRQLESGALPPALAALAPERIAESHRYFDEGAAVVRGKRPSFELG